MRNIGQSVWAQAKIAPKGNECSTPWVPIREMEKLPFHNGLYPEFEDFNCAPNWLQKSSTLTEKNNDVVGTNSFDLIAGAIGPYSSRPGFDVITVVTSDSLSLAITRIDLFVVLRQRASYSCKYGR